MKVWPCARLVDHLLVELADAAAAVDQEDAEEAAVGDRAGVRDREPPRALRPRDHAGRAVPDDPRPQLGELVGRVAAGEHVEHVLELRHGTRSAKGYAPRTSSCSVDDRDLLVSADRDDLLGEHVERVARDLRLLDLAAAHRARDDRRLEQVGAELREDAALRDRRRARDRRGRPAAGRARPTSGSRPGSRGRPRPCRSRARATTSRRGTGCGPPSGLPRSSTRCSRASEPWWARAMLCLGQLVEAKREPLGETPVVDEHDRRAVLADEAAGARDRSTARSSRASLGATRRWARACRRAGRQPRGRAPCGCPRRRARSGGRRRRSARSPSSGRWVAERPMRCNGLSRRRVEALERQREMRAALRAGDGMDLVHDHRLDRRAASRAPARSAAERATPAS